MSFKQLVYRNIIRNPRAYLSYFMSSVFSVTVFFTAALLYYHPLLEDNFLDGNTRLTPLTLYSSSSSLFGWSLLIIGCLALFFLGSMFQMFLRERRYDFSLYLILGMTKQKLKAMIAWESSIIGSTSVVTGIGLGLAFSKLMLLISQNVLSLDYPLGIYLPKKAIVVTVGVYLVIFSLITFLTITFVQSKQTNMNLAVNNRLASEPSISTFLTKASYICLIVSYLSFFALGFLTRWQLKKFSIVLDFKWLVILALIACVLLLLGMYLFYTHGLVKLVMFFRERPQVLKKNRLLILSSLTANLKRNGLFNFIIAISSTLALLIITSTLLLAQVELYGTDQANSLAYTYRAYNVKDKSDITFHQTNIEFIRNTIEKAGYQVRTSQIEDGLTLILQSDQSIPNFYQDSSYVTASANRLNGETKLLNIIPLSEYNSMARFNQLPELTLKDPYELVLLTNHFKQPNKLYTGKVEYEEELATQLQKVSFRFLQGSYQAGSRLINVSVVSNSFFSDIKTAYQNALPRLEREWASNDPENVAEHSEEGELVMPFYIIHFREWAQASAVDHQVRQYLKERQELINQLILENEEEYEATVDQYTYFDYSSSYQTLSQRDEEKGATLFVSTIVGTVFFIFSAFLIYFRLFGQAEQDSRDQRLLDLIGIPSKNRHDLLSFEIVSLFLFPGVIALLNYLVFGIIIQGVLELNVWLIMVKVGLLFISIQVLSYFIARKKYLETINHQLKQIKNY